MEYLPSGKVVGGRYCVEDLIGEGGMAAVYRVRHAQLDTLHALKVLTLSSKSVQRRLMQEGRVQAAINHPNILSVTDVVDVDGAPGLVMEFIRGPALDDFLIKKQLSPTQADSLAVPILDGVAAAHGLGLIHRDLKPANVMLAVTPHGLLPKVADFGLVKLLADEGDAAFSKTRSGMAMGTPAYMAPEQIRDAKNVDARADVWSLGAILYEMASGHRAFGGDGDLLEMFNRVAKGDYTPLREVAPDLPERMYEAVDAAMTIDRDARVGTVVELKRMWTGQEAVGDASLEDLLSAAQSMGGTEEETSEFLKRSFRSREAYRSEVPGATALNEAQNAETYLPDDFGGKAHRTAPTLDHAKLGAQSAETLSPFADGHSETLLEAEVSPPSETDRRRSMGMALIGLGALGILAVPVVGYVALQQLTTPDETEVAVVEPEPELVIPEPAPTEPEGTAEPEPAEPAPAAAPTALPKPTRPVPATTKTPVPPPVEPEGTTEPTPKPAPQPEASVAPASAGTAEAYPTVKVDSDVTVFFLDGTRRPADLDALAPGTYTVAAVFDPTNPDEHTDIESVTVAAGDTISVKCLGSQRRCRVSSK